MTVTAKRCGDACCSAILGSSLQLTKGPDRSTTKFALLLQQQQDQQGSFGRARIFQHIARRTSGEREAVTVPFTQLDGQWARLRNGLRRNGPYHVSRERKLAATARKTEREQ